MYANNSGSGVFLATVARTSTGFGAATWVPIDDPAAPKVSTGNSILENTLIGLYPVEGGLQSYAATVTIAAAAATA